jgi:hypothetical protein
MKKITTILASAAMAATFSTAAFAADLMVAGAATMDKKGSIELSGKGFPAEAPVTLIFATADGVESDITYALDPAPVADADGAFTTTWSYGRFVKKKLVAPGAFDLQATDADFTLITETKVTFTE